MRGGKGVTESTTEVQEQEAIPIIEVIDTIYHPNSGIYIPLSAFLVSKTPKLPDIF